QGTPWALPFAEAVRIPLRGILRFGKSYVFCVWVGVVPYPPHWVWVVTLKPVTRPLRILNFTVPSGERYRPARGFFGSLTCLTLTARFATTPPAALAVRTSFFGFLRPTGLTRTTAVAELPWRRLLSEPAFTLKPLPL